VHVYRVWLNPHDLPYRKYPFLGVGGAGRTHVRTTRSPLSPAPLGAPAPCRNVQGHYLHLLLPIDTTQRLPTQSSDRGPGSADIRDLEFEHLSNGGGRGEGGCAKAPGVTTERSAVRPYHENHKICVQLTIVPWCRWARCGRRAGRSPHNLNGLQAASRQEGGPAVGFVPTLGLGKLQTMHAYLSIPDTGQAGACKERGRHPLRRQRDRCNHE
jgi:hypothetical protein